MSLRASAHTGVAIRSPRRETYHIRNTWGKFVTPYGFAGKNYYLFCATARGNGLPRRFAPRNDMQKEEALLRLQERRTQ